MKSGEILCTKPGGPNGVFCFSYCGNAFDEFAHLALSSRLRQYYPGHGE
jgi:hypothetical protein